MSRRFSLVADSRFLICAELCGAAWALVHSRDSLRVNLESSRERIENIKKVERGAVSALCTPQAASVSNWCDRVLAVRHDAANVRRIESIQEDIRREQKLLEKALEDCRSEEEGDKIEELQEALTKASSHVSHICLTVFLSLVCLLGVYVSLCGILTGCDRLVIRNYTLKSSISSSCA